MERLGCVVDTGTSSAPPREQFDLFRSRHMDTSGLNNWCLTFPLSKSREPEKQGVEMCQQETKDD